MGGGSVVPYGDDVDRLSDAEQPAMLRKAPASRHGHGNMNREVGKEPVMSRKVSGAHRGPMERDAQTGPGVRTRDMDDHASLSPPESRAAESSKIHDFKYEIAKLKSNHFRERAKLQALDDKYDGSERLYDEGVNRLRMIEEDIARLEYEEQESGEVSDGTEDYDMNIHSRHSREARRKDQVSDLPKHHDDRAAMKNKGRPFAGSGNDSGRRMAETSISDISRGISRLDVESRNRKGANMAREMRQPTHHREMEDYADEESDHQPRGSHHGRRLPPAGHGYNQGHHHGNNHGHHHGNNHGHHHGNHHGHYPNHY